MNAKMYIPLLGAALACLTGCIVMGIFDFFRSAVHRLCLLLFIFHVFISILFVFLHLEASPYAYGRISRD